MVVNVQHENWGGGGGKYMRALNLEPRLTDYLIRLKLFVFKM
jgi:hypothetical protein